MRLHVMRHNVLDHTFHPFRSGNGCLNGDQLTADPENDWTTNFDVNIRSVRVDRSFEDPRKNFHVR
jgi:hypothetical protein